MQGTVREAMRRSAVGRGDGRGRIRALRRAPAARADAPLLQLAGIVKQFPGCLANDRVDLAVRAGEIHALLGENGAGKTTLVKIIYGVLRPDAGRNPLARRTDADRQPGLARKLGIGMVFQHFSLFEALTVAENIALGINDRAPAHGLCATRIVEVSAELWAAARSRSATVHDLSVGERQRVEIVRCLLQNPKLLIMDEPTSVLTPQEIERLFDTLRRLAAEGCAILYISHKLEEIRALCERATILRRRQGGGRAATRARRRREHLAELMIGSELQPPSHRQDGSRRGRAGAAGGASSRSSRDRPVRRRSRRMSSLSVARRRGPRHRRRRRQRPDRADGGAVRRDSWPTAPRPS